MNNMSQKLIEHTRAELESAQTELHSLDKHSSASRLERAYARFQAAQEKWGQVISSKRKAA